MVRTTFRKRKNIDIAIFKDGKFRGSFNIKRGTIGVKDNNPKLKSELKREIKRRLRK